MKELILYSGGTTQVSDEDFLEYMPFNWHINGWGYVFRRLSIKGKPISVFLHVEIFKRKENNINSIEVDHIDRNRLNNQRNNLRNSTRSQNACNRALQSNNKSGFRNIMWDKRSKKWRASIKVNGLYIHIGSYTSKAQAIHDYKIMARFHYGEFAIFDDEG